MHQECLKKTYPHYIQSFGSSQAIFFDLYQLLHVKQIQSNPELCKTSTFYINPNYLPCMLYRITAVYFGAWYITRLLLKLIKAN